MTRFAVDYLDVLLDLLRPALPGVQVWSKIPDNVPDYLPLVVLDRTGGSSNAPEFFDQPLVQVQCWAADNRSTGVDAIRAASDLADQVRGVLWTAYRTQQVVPGRGWIGWVRESSGPQEIPDPDLPFVGRFVATYELRVRPAA